MSIDKVAAKIANYINKSKGAQKALKGMSDNPALGGAATSFILAGFIRPASILAITPDKDDAKYGACSSISAALTEIAASYAIFKPMNNAIANSSRELYKTKGSMFYENPLLLREYKSVTNRLGKIPPLIGVAILRFALVVPISKLLGKFGVVKATNRGDKEKKLDVKA